MLDLRNPFFTDLAEGVEARAAEEELSVLLANSAESPRREQAHLDLFGEQRLRGILISPVGDHLEQLAHLRSRGITCVLVDRQAASIDWSSVSVDDVEGGRIAARYLLEAGCRRLLFVGGPLDLAQVHDRLRGARQATAEVAGATLEVLPIAGLTMQHGVEAGRHIALGRIRVDGVFAGNDLVALGVLQGALHEGLRIPEEVALVAYDDIDFAAAAAVPITSVRQPRQQLGRRAVELLLNEIHGGGERQRIVLPPDLAVRASSRLGG